MVKDGGEMVLNGLQVIIDVTDTHYKLYKALL